MRRFHAPASLAAVVLAAFICAGAGSQTVARLEDPVLGNPKGPVRVVVYQDLECPSCALWHKQFLSTFIPQYGARVAFEFRDFPLPQHTWSFNAAVLARFFDTRNAKLGNDWRDYCFQHQDDLTNPGLIDAAARFAAPYGITRAELEQVFSRTDLYAAVKADQDKGNRDRVDHTPFVMVNGVPLSQDAVPICPLAHPGDKPCSDLKSALDRALAHP